MLGITPIYKDSDKMEQSNYRPIPILLSLNKVFELAIKTFINISKDFGQTLTVTY